jgi:hypothetical protein
MFLVAMYLLLVMLSGLDNPQEVLRNNFIANSSITTGGFIEYNLAPLINNNKEAFTPVS